MVEQFKDIINKNMPAMVGQELKEILEHYEIIKKENKELKNDLSDHEEALDKARSERDKLKAKLNEITGKEQELNTKIKEYDERLVRQEVDNLSIQLKSETKSKEDIFKLASIVFKNPQYKKVSSSNGWIDNPPDQYGNTTSRGTCNTTTEEFQETDDV